MPETANISRMAEILSKEIFIEFLWRDVGPLNTNWSCEDQSLHKVRTHPSDVVFYYDEPYTNTRTYVNCDLKSYARGSINTYSVKSALQSLSKSLTCAEKSYEWRNRYIHDHVSAEICGLLFIYNHDGNYDKEFKLILNSVKYQDIDIPKKTKIFVLGPQDIYWLNNVRNEIVQMRGLGLLPDRESCRFFYPHLVRKKNIQIDKAKAATLEMLTAPWIILTYHEKSSNLNKKSFLVFYRGAGETVSEFLYLIDYLVNYQVVGFDTEIQIKALDSDLEAPSLFDKAKGQYLDAYGGGDIKEKLESIKYSNIRNVQPNFSEIEIGMDNG